jgi:hypothetical protein
MHPYKTLQIQNIEVNLPATLSIYENPIYDSAVSNSCGENTGSLFAPCYPPVHEWLDIIPLPAHAFSNNQPTASPVTVTVTVASGETQTVIFKVSQKDACRQNMAPRGGGGGG